MSVLSATHYKHLNKAIVLLKAQLKEQQQEQNSNFDKIAIKTKFLEQQLLQEQQKIMKQEKQTSSKVDKFSAEVRAGLKEVFELHNQNEGLNDLQKQFRQLTLVRDKIVKSKEAVSNVIAEKLQQQIDFVMQQVKDQTELNKRETKQLQFEFKQEIETVQNRLKANQEKLDNSRIFQQLEMIQAAISKEIAGLRSKRIERKQNFLNLLETIIVKCKKDKDEE